MKIFQSGSLCQLNPQHCEPRDVDSGNPVLHHSQILARTFRVFGQHTHTQEKINKNDVDL